MVGDVQLVPLVERMITPPFPTATRVVPEASTALRCALTPEVCALQVSPALLETITLPKEPTAVTTPLVPHAMSFLAVPPPAEGVTSTHEIPSAERATKPPAPPTMKWPWQ